MHDTEEIRIEQRCDNPDPVCNSWQFDNPAENWVCFFGLTWSSTDTDYKTSCHYNSRTCECRPEVTEGVINGGDVTPIWSEDGIDLTKPGTYHLYLRGHQPAPTKSCRYWVDPDATDSVAIIVYDAGQCTTEMTPEMVEACPGSKAPVSLKMTNNTDHVEMFNYEVTVSDGGASGIAVYFQTPWGREPVKGDTAHRSPGESYEVCFTVDFTNAYPGASVGLIAKLTNSACQPAGGDSSVAIARETDIAFADPDLPGADEDTSPGGVIRVNDDDDNADGIPDKDEAGPIFGEDDLRRLKFYNSFPPDVPEGATWTLSWTGSFRVWANADKSGAELVNGFRHPWSEPLPTHVYVEATEPSQGGFRLTIEDGSDICKGSGSCYDEAVATGVRVSLDTDSNNDGQIAADDDPIEESSPGRYLERSADSAEGAQANLLFAGQGYSLLENEQNSVLCGQGDLAPIRLAVQPYVPEINATLDVPDNLRVWTTADKQALAALEWPISGIPGTLWVEGLQPGQATLTLSAYGVTDTVKMTVVDADIQFPDLPDELEATAPGGILCRNSDDDDSDGQSDYLETGLVSDEDDLKEISLNTSYTPTAGELATWSLDVSSPAKVHIWLNSEKSDAIVSGQQYDWPPPATVYLEGTEASQTAGDITLQFNVFRNTRVLCNDCIVLTVVTPRITQAVLPNGFLAIPDKGIYTTTKGTTHQETQNEIQVTYKCEPLDCPCDGDSTIELWYDGNFVDARGNESVRKLQLDVVSVSAPTDVEQTVAKTFTISEQGVYSSTDGIYNYGTYYLVVVSCCGNSDWFPLAVGKPIFCNIDMSPQAHLRAQNDDLPGPYPMCPYTDSHPDLDAADPEHPTLAHEWFGLLLKYKLNANLQNLTVNVAGKDLRYLATAKTTGTDRKIKWEGYDSSVIEPAEDPACVFGGQCGDGIQAVNTLAPERVVPEGVYSYTILGKVSSTPLQLHQITDLEVYVKYDMLHDVTSHD